MKNKNYSKMVAIFALVLAMAVSSLFALPATLCYGQGGYAAVGVSGEPVSGLTLLAAKIDAEGVLTKDVTAKSDDKLCQLALNKGTKVLSKRGGRLSGVVIVEMEEPPVPPEDSNVIGLTYDLGPDGATFDPPITITFTYDPALIPAGVVEENLVIAIWDEEAGEWVNLVSTVDPITNTITALVGHFTAFTVLSYTGPAVFATNDLTISPAEVDIGETVTISVLVANTGDLTSSYEVTLKIDNVAVATKDVTLAGGASQRVTFTTSEDAAGTYAVNVDYLSGTFTVVAPPAPPAPPPPPPAPAAFTASALTISPTEVDVGETVTISIQVANTGDVTGSYEVTLKVDNVVVATKDVTLAGGASQKVTFTAAKDKAGTYTVNVDGLSGTFAVKPPITPINWWLIGGIIAACVIIGVVVWQVVIRRRA